MFRQGEVRPLECCPRVALFAAISPGSPGKLPVVFILVAIHAERILDLESSRLSGWSVAGRTLHLGMRKHQWKSRLRVICNREGRGTPSLHRVAAFASSTVRAMGKLTAVRIRLMAGCAAIVRNWSFEVSTLMTGQAWNLDVFSEQGKLSL